MTLSLRNNAYLALIANTIIWGAALPIVKPALGYVSPFDFLFFRYLVGLIISLPIFIYLLIHYRPSFSDLLKIGAIEIVAVGLANGLLYAGLSQTSSIEAGLITNTAPIFIAISGFLFLKEKIEPRELLGMIIALTAVALIALEPFLFDLENVKFSSVTGNVLVLGHNFFWMIYVILAKKYYQKTPKILTGFVGLYSGSIFFLVFHWLSKGLTESFSVASLMPLTNLEVLLPVVYMGLLGTAIAVPLYVYGNNLIESSEASLFVYLQPLVYLPLGFFLLQEKVTVLMILALTTACFGVALASIRPPQRMMAAKSKDSG